MQLMSHKIALFVLPHECARADKSYFRWVPRIEAGRDFLVLELGANIDKENWPEVLKTYEI